MGLFWEVFRSQDPLNFLPLAFDFVDLDIYGRENDEMAPLASPALEEIQGEPAPLQPGGLGPEWRRRGFETRGECEVEGPLERKIGFTFQAEC